MRHCAHKSVMVYDKSGDPRMVGYGRCMAEAFVCLTIKTVRMLPLFDRLASASGLFELMADFNTINDVGIGTES